jgi:hypothetical protein
MLTNQPLPAATETYSTILLYLFNTALLQIQSVERGQYSQVVYSKVARRLNYAS